MRPWKEVLVEKINELQELLEQYQGDQKWDVKLQTRVSLYVQLVLALKGLVKGD